MTARAERVAQVFGERLRELREKRGGTTRSPAEIAGTSYTYVNDLERGIKTPTLATSSRHFGGFRVFQRWLRKL